MRETLAESESVSESDSVPGSTWRDTARYVTYRGVATALGRLPEPLARGAAGGVARIMAQRGGPALAMNERHIRLGATERGSWCGA